MTRILFITSTRIGDAVLSTGLIDHLARTRSEPRFTIVCGPLPAPLFAGVPGLERLIVLQKKPWNQHWISLWSQTVGTVWDVVVDLRNSAVSRLLLARERYTHGHHIDGARHKVEQNAQVLGLGTVPAPRLWPTAEQTRRAAQLVPDLLPVIGVGPTANWIGKTWPGDRFIEVIDQLTRPGGLYAGAAVAVFAAPGEEIEAHKVLNAIPQDRRINMIAKGDPGVAAAALSRCRFYIGNDSGLMHCAAAMGVPTLGLFGPSYPAIYRPWGPQAAYVRTPETFDELKAFPGYNPKTLTHTLMESLTVEMVMEKISNSFSG